MSDKSKKKVGWFNVAIAKLALIGPQLWFKGFVLGDFAIGIIRKGDDPWKVKNERTR